MLDVTKPRNTPGDQGALVARRANRRRFILLAAAVVVAAAAGFGAWAKFFSPVKVPVAHPAANVAVQVFGLGTVEARVASKVGFKIAGLLVDLRADVGNRVAKGAVLARLDDREQKAQVARAQAAVEQAEANLQKANASVQKAQANYENAKRINERRQQLVQSKTTSVEAAETAKAAQDAALPVAGEVDRQRDDPDGRYDEADIGGDVVVGRAEAAVDIRVRIIAEDAAHDEEEKERQGQRKDHGRRLAEEELYLHPGEFPQRFHD
ncbi:MAG: hypothetical protein P8Y53_01675, partial [Pseudolabrys sp.]